jgi:cobalt-zinc-cadmium efflux system membrane fusion protein
MKKVRIILWLVFPLLLSCGGDLEMNSPGASSQEDTDAAEGTHQHDGEDSHSHVASDGMGDLVELTTEQVSNIGVRFGRIESRPIRSLVKLTGRIELPPSGKAMVGSALEGKITKVHVTAGQKVATGQKLFTLQNLDIIDWKQELAAHKARMEFLEMELERQKTIADEDLGPEKNFQEVQSEGKQVQARVSALVSKLDAIGVASGGSDYQSMFSVVAPSSGTVQHLRVSNGEYVQTNTALAEIINSNSLHLHLQAYGVDIERLSTGQRLDFYVQSRPDQIMAAEIFWINKMINEGSNSYDVHAEIMGNLAGLSAGEFVEARVISQEQTAQSVPTQAVAMDRGLHYLFIMDHIHDEDVSFRKVQIMLGESDLGYVEVKPVDPISADAEVVINGAFFLMAQSKKGEEGAGGHHH